jgi:hypothetical protein
MDGGAAEPCSYDNDHEPLISGDVVCLQFLVDEVPPPLLDHEDCDEDELSHVDATGGKAGLYFGYVNH